jgi:cyanophycinase
MRTSSTRGSSMSERGTSERATSGPGTIIAIGGHEDRDGERVILRAVAEAMQAGPLLILATASRRPHQYYLRYSDAFDGIGVHGVRNLAVRDRFDAEDPALLGAVASAGGVFLTGGSQLRFVEAIRDTALHRALAGLHERGGVVAGTSAGASALGECMLSGTRDLRLTDGLRLVPGLMIDQHFSERDRIGRLTEGIARMPACTGLGIDQDTAAVIRGDEVTVIGSGDVWVIEEGSSARRVPPGGRFALGDTIAA